MHKAASKLKFKPLIEVTKAALKYADLVFFFLLNFFTFKFLC